MNLEHSSFACEHKKTPSYMQFFAGGALPFWSPTAMNKTYLIYICVLVVVVLCISFLLVLRARKNQSPDKGLTFEVDPDEFIASIFDRAVEMQLKLDIVCTRPSLKQKHIQCFGVPDMLSPDDTCVAAALRRAAQEQNPKKQDKKEPAPYLTLKLVEGSIPDGWDQAPIDVYLQLVQNGQGTLYHFASFVCKILRKDDALFMTIIRPSVLGNSQSREEVRIEPSPGSVALASAWLYAKDSQMLPDKVKSLGKSFGVFRPEGNSDFRIVNISACGIRLRLVREDIEKLSFPLEKNMELCLFLAVNTPQEKSHRMLVWIKAVCKGLAPCAEDDCVDVRFSFTHWQQIYEKSESILWEDVGGASSVPPIMHWIMNSAYGMYGDRHIIEQSTQAVTRSA